MRSVPSHFLLSVMAIKLSSEASVQPGVRVIVQLSKARQLLDKDALGCMPNI